MYIDSSYCPQSFGHFRHPEQCFLYINCHDHIAFVQKCPESKYFDDVANKCDLKHKVDCGTRTTFDDGSSGSKGSKTVTTGGHQSTITTYTDDSGMY